MDLSTEEARMWVSKLTETGVMHEGEQIIEHVKGDFWEFGAQVRGHYLFTEEAVVFVGGINGAAQWRVDYKSIQEVNKKNIKLIICTGIAIKYINEKGKLKKKVLSILKRNDWIEFISKRLSGNTQ